MFRSCELVLCARRHHLQLPPGSAALMSISGGRPQGRSLIAPDVDKVSDQDRNDDEQREHEKNGGHDAYGARLVAKPMIRAYSAASIPALIYINCRRLHSLCALRKGKPGWATSAVELDRPGYFSPTTGLRRQPMPGISTSITSPGLIRSTLPGAPVRMMSPGCSVQYLLMPLTMA